MQQLLGALQLLETLANLGLSPVNYHVRDMGSARGLAKGSRTPVDLARGLPDDVLGLIISQLSLPDVCNLRQVCKSLREAVFRLRELVIKYKYPQGYTISHDVIARIINDFPRIYFSLCYQDFELGKIPEPQTVAMFPMNFSTAILRNNNEHMLFSLTPAFRNMKSIFIYEWKEPFIFNAIGKSEIGAFDHIEHLTFSWCTFAGVDLTPLKNIKKISFIRCYYMDITPIANNEFLEFVDSWSITGWELLGSQKHLRIIRMDITDVSNLGKVENLSLTNCRLLKDISALKDVPNLLLINCKNIRDYSMLGNQKSLVITHCAFKCVKNLSRVRILYLFHTNVTDVTPLANADFLYIKSKYVRDISALCNVPELVIELNNVNSNELVVFPGAENKPRSSNTYRYNYSARDKRPIMNPFKYIF